MKNHPSATLVLITCLLFALQATAQTEPPSSRFTAPTLIEGNWVNSDGKGSSFSIKQVNGQWLVSHTALQRGCGLSDAKAYVGISNEGILNFRVLPGENGQVNLCGKKYNGELFLTGEKAGTGKIEIDFSAAYQNLTAKFKNK